MRVLLYYSCTSNLLIYLWKQSPLAPMRSRVTSRCSYCLRLKPFTVSFLFHIPFALTTQLFTLTQQHPQKRQHNNRHANIHPLFHSRHLIILGQKNYIHHCHIHSKYCNGHVRVSEESHICSFKALAVNKGPCSSAKLHQSFVKQEFPQPFARNYSII